MAVKHIIIHAGLLKTGTSSIQETLYYNAQTLRKHGFLYMNEWGMGHHRLVYQLFVNKPWPDHDSHASTGPSAAETRKENEKNLRVLLETLAGHPACETLILSAESISYRFETADLSHMRDQLQTLFPQARFLFMLYVREPVKWWVSGYQQAAARPFTVRGRDWQACLEHALHRPRLTAMAGVFGDALRVFRFEDAVADSDGLTGHFLKAIGYPEKALADIQTRRSNTSRGMETVEFLASLGEAVPLYVRQDGCTADNPLRNRLDVGPVEFIPGGKFDLPYAQKQEILTFLKDDLLWLKENYGIDYTSTVVEEERPTAGYGDETIDRFLQAFPYLTGTLKTFFLGFFQARYRQTGDERFKKLFASGSAPWQIYQIPRVDEYLRDAARISRRAVGWGVERPMAPDCARISLLDENNRPVAVPPPTRHTPDHEGRLRFCESFGETGGLCTLRIDPSRYTCVAVLVRLIVNGKEDNYTVSAGNYDEQHGNAFFFFRDSPRLFISCEAPVRSVEGELVVDTGSFTYARLNAAWAAKEAVRNEKAMKRMREALAREKEAHEKLRQAHGALRRSASWRITKPLRVIMGKARRT